ncbi:MAG: MBL fold metallo-hydrolase [Gammaproteobacteria bacterium]|nr:MBL fold metallo-hydrolase [Gammaproteobacteria bacterium]
MKKSLILLAVVGVIGLLVLTQRSAILTRVMERGIEARLGADHIETLPDGLHLSLCGAGGPLAAPNASGPCVAVVAGQSLYVVDAGTDGIRNLTRLGYQPGTIRAVLLTHFHSDHIDGLGEIATLRWAGGGSKTPLPVYGPRGVERIVDGFNQAYAQDFQYRHDHHGDLVADLAGAGMTARPFEQPPMGQLVTVLRDGDLTIEALRVEHAPVDPAVGYRFSYKGRTLLITGDTKKSANIQTFAQGVDLLVHEALAPNLVNMMNAAAEKSGNAVMAKVTHDILDYHASPVEAAETARDAQVGHLLYYHIVPPLVIPGQKSLFLNGAQDIFSAYTIGQDGTSFSLPANSKEIIKTQDGL